MLVINQTDLIDHFQLLPAQSPARHAGVKGALPRVVKIAVWSLIVGNLCWWDGGEAEERLRWDGVGNLFPSPRVFHQLEVSGAAVGLCTPSPDITTRLNPPSLVFASGGVSCTRTGSSVRLC